MYIPRWLSDDDPQVKRFINEGLKKLDGQIPPPRTMTTTPDDIRQLTLEWASRMGLSPKRITIREMQRKWGSCSSRGNITLNASLCTLQPDLIEYVVVHELAHLTVFDHSPRFWALVGQYLPDYEVRRQELDRYPV